MFETPITVCGNVLTKPEFRQTRETRVTVLNFLVGSTARRMDRQTNTWADGDTVRLRVVCWRALAENAGKSLNVGDAVIVQGRLITRDWVDDDGQKRVSYQLEAYSIGHDMSRGTSTFARRRAQLSTSAVEDGTVGQIRGEHTDPLPEELVGLHGRDDSDDEAESDTADANDKALVGVG